MVTEEEMRKKYGTTVEIFDGAANQGGEGVGVVAGGERREGRV